MQLSKSLQTFFLIFLLLILPFVTSYQINDSQTNDIPQENQINTFQSSFICFPTKLINLTEYHNSLLHCFSYTIFGTQNNSEVSWLDEGFSLHLIFYNESYDLGIRNSSYDEYVRVSDWVKENLGLIDSYNETYYYDSRDLVAKKDNNGEISYYHPDHLGSTTLITNSSWDVVENTFYMPYGEVISGGEDRFGYTSKEKDTETNLNYYGARYYDSYSMHFTQADSVIADVYNPQSLNRYSYVLNNPYKYVDPTGNVVEDIPFIIADIFDLVDNPKSLMNWASLGIDVALLLAPGIGGAGFFGKNVVKTLDNAGDAVKVADKVSDAAKVVDKGGDVARTADKVGDATSSTFSTKAEALEYVRGGNLPSGVSSTANKFFNKASSSTKFSITNTNSGYKFSHFSPARTPGYGKSYNMITDLAGAITERVKQTIGPIGQILKTTHY